MAIHMQRHDALLIVDVQPDFLPGGALAVREGDQVVPVLNRYIALARQKQIPVFASRDWHPANHCSFAARGGPWPPYCVAGTEGAQIAAGLNYAYFAHGMRDTVVFELFVRRLPPNRNFEIAAGLDQAFDFLENLRFAPDELERMRFTGDVHATPEGR